MSSPPEPARPRPAAPRSYLAEQEARRLLTTAHIHLRRGQLVEAERLAQEARTKLPEDAEVEELLGDIRLAQGEFDDAQAAYRAALVKEPGRATAEAKLARASLRQSETQRKARIGVAYAASGAALMRSGGEDDPGRRARMAVASAFLPGLGQIMGGAYVKGGIIAGVYALGWLLFSLTADRSTLTGLTDLGRAAHRGGGSLGGLPLCALALLTLDWVYAVVDGAILAGRKDSLNKLRGDDHEHDIVFQEKRGGSGRRLSPAPRFLPAAAAGAAASGTRVPPASASWTPPTSTAVTRPRSSSTAARWTATPNTSRRAPAAARRRQPLPLRPAPERGVVHIHA